MKDFDITKIGKKMPYKAPSEDFFADFTQNIMERVEEIERVERVERVEGTRRQRVFSLPRRLVSSLGIAAAVAIVATLSLNLLRSPQITDDLLLASDNIEASLDAYFASLSDEELSSIASSSSYNEEFYYNLPNN